MAIVQPTTESSDILDEFIATAKRHLATITGTVTTTSVYNGTPAPGQLPWVGYTVPDGVGRGVSASSQSVDQAFSTENTREAVQSAGSGIVNDEPDVVYDVQVTRLRSSLPLDRPSGVILNDPMVASIPTSNGTSIPLNCTAAFDYTSNLTPNFKVQDVSSRAIFPHWIRPQRGLTANQIVCNLQHISINILEPIRARFPNMFVTSGFRVSDVPAGTRASWHTVGSAVDIQFRGFSHQECLDAAQWVVAHIPFNTFIFEHGNRIWFHIDLPSSGQMNKRIMTMYRDQYTDGLRLYYR